MDVDFDFSDVDSFFDEGEWEVEKKMIDVGDEAVKYAEENGDYQDHTLTNPRCALSRPASHGCSFVNGARKVYVCCAAASFSFALIIS